MNSATAYRKTPDTSNALDQSAAPIDVDLKTDAEGRSIASNCSQDGPMPTAFDLAVAIVKDAGFVVIPRDAAVDADIQLSASGHGRPPEKDECLRLSDIFRKAYERPRT